MNDYLMYGLISAFVVVILYFILGRKKEAEVEELESERSEPVQPPQPVQSAPVNVIPIKKEKRRAKSKRGSRLSSRNRRDFDEYDDDLFDMTFSGFYHPYRTLYLFDWFWDNELDDDEYSLELFDDMGFEGAVLADIYFENGQNVVDFLNEAGEVVGTASLSEDGGVIVNDHEYTVDGDSGQVQMTNGDDEATWSDEDGYNLNSDLSDEHISVDDQGVIGFASEQESVVDPELDKHVELEEYPEPEHIPEPEPEHIPEPEPEVVSAPDISSPSESTSSTDY
jgi:hypothetical protein